MWTEVLGRWQSFLRRRRGRNWRALAVELGLQYRGPVGEREAEIFGDIDGHGVRVVLPARSHLIRPRVFLYIDTKGAVPRELWLERRPLAVDASVVETQTRDYEFDQLVACGGAKKDCPILLALLTGSVRTAIAAAVRRANLVLRDGELISWHPFVGGADRCLEIIRAEIALAKRLAISEDDWPRRLLISARGEDLSEARRKKYKIFFRTVSDPFWLSSGIEAARNDPHPQIQLYAAVREGNEVGFDKAVAVVCDSNAPVGVREVALQHLLERHSLSKIIPVLTRVCDEGPEDLRLMAIIAFGTWTYEPALSILSKMTRTASDVECIRMAWCATKIGGLQAERLTLKLLRHPSSLQVRVAAARALSATGTASAVAELRAHTGVFTPWQLRRAAHEAIESIHARLKNAEVGQLALTESTSNDEAGLSYAEPGELAYAEGSLPGI